MLKFFYQFISSSNCFYYFVLAQQYLCSCHDRIHRLDKTRVFCFIWSNYYLQIYHSSFSFDSIFPISNSHPTGNYMFKVNNRNTRLRCEICSKLTIMTPERPSASIANFEEVSGSCEDATNGKCVIREMESCIDHIDCCKYLSNIASL